MSSIDWDLLIKMNTEPSIHKVAVAFVVHHYLYAFIARRHVQDYLKGCYELPEGILEDNETVNGAAHRILLKHYGVELLNIKHFLNSFAYTSANRERTRMFVFCATVKDPFKMKLDRNDHGVWLGPSEMRNWPIITYFQESLLHFWTGESYNPMLAATLVEQAKVEGYWRQKVRAVLFNKEGEILFLKRARRNKVMPLLYELPGKEIEFSSQIDSALIASVTEQTGWAPRGIRRYLGHYDYYSEATKSLVREYLYALHAQDKPVKLSEHAYYVWESKLNSEELSLTPSAKMGYELFLERFFLKKPSLLKVPPTIYFDPTNTLEEQANKQYLDAMDELTRFGKIDMEALRGKPLIKKAIPSEYHKDLGLD